MTALNLTEAVEAAAEQIAYGGHDKSAEYWAILPDSEKGLYLRRGHAALTAALPALAEAFAAHIEAEGRKDVGRLADTRTPGDKTDMGRLIGTEDAYKASARLVRALGGQA